MDIRSLRPRAFPAALTLPAGVHFGSIGSLVSFPIVLAAGPAAAQLPDGCRVRACVPAYAGREFRCSDVI